MTVNINKTDYTDAEIVAAVEESLSELMDILDDSCFDGDICEFLQDNTIPYQ